MPDPIEIGKYFKLFPTTSPSQDCLIAAHGGYKDNLPFDVCKGATVLFYTPHGRKLSFGSLEDYMGDDLAVESSYGECGGNGMSCPDYILKKMQNSMKKRDGTVRNDAGQTYDTVKEAITETERFLASSILSIDNPTKNMTKDQAQKNARSSIPMNILVVRSSASKPDVKLSLAIQEVKRKVPTIKRFHCGFCRGLIGDTNPQQGMSVQKKF